MSARYDTSMASGVVPVSFCLLGRDLRSPMITTEQSNAISRFSVAQVRKMAYIMMRDKVEATYIRYLQENFFFSF